MVKAFLIIGVAGLLWGAVTGTDVSPNAEPPTQTSTQHSAADNPAWAAEELTKDTPLRRRLIKAAEHLPPSASMEEITALAQGEAEESE